MPLISNQKVYVSIVAGNGPGHLYPSTSLDCFQRRGNEARVVHNRSESSLVKESKEDSDNRLQPGH